MQTTLRSNAENTKKNLGFIPLAETPKGVERSKLSAESVARVEDEVFSLCSI